MPQNPPIHLAFTSSAEVPSSSKDPELTISRDLSESVKDSRVVETKITAGCSVDAENGPATKSAKALPSIPKGHHEASPAQSNNVVPISSTCLPQEDHTKPDVSIPPHSTSNSKGLPSEHSPIRTTTMVLPQTRSSPGEEGLASEDAPTANTSVLPPPITDESSTDNVVVTAESAVPESPFRIPAAPFEELSGMSVPLPSRPSPQQYDPETAPIPVQRSSQDENNPSAVPPPTSTCMMTTPQPVPPPCLSELPYLNIGALSLAQSSGVSTNLLQSTLSQNPLVPYMPTDEDEDNVDSDEKKLWTPESDIIRGEAEETLQPSPRVGFDCFS